ncbi:MAG: DUF1275 family protein [Phycisphaeraceae bacterium]|nr:DUF1275 family protein [Phycisphaeraceae bacterium]
MFVAQAHSFAQQARLAITLAWVAGYANVVSVLTCGTTISHMTGVASNLGRDAAVGAWGLWGFAAFLLVMFFLGAMTTGVLTEIGRRRGWDSVYVLPIGLEAVLLGVFAIGVELHDPTAHETGLTLYWMTGAASMAMGIQNAAITHISSGVVRTTHVTGVLTDLGLECVKLVTWLRGRRQSHPPPAVDEIRRHATARRVLLLTSIIGSFVLGAALGVLAYGWIPRSTMLPPVAFLLWIIYQDIARPIAEIEPSVLQLASAGLKLPPQILVYHLRKDRERERGVHRMPNLLAWLDRVDPNAKVIILDLDEVTQLDADSAIELRAALARLKQEGRAMVIAGLTREQYDQLARGGDLLDPMSVCADVELAIARGLVLLEELGEK